MLKLFKSFDSATLFYCKKVKFKYSKLLSSKIMAVFNKYVKIVILSTLEQPKKLIEISKTWFNNNGRLYHPLIIKEIDKAVEDKILVKNGKFYEPNMAKLLDLMLEMDSGDDKAVREYKSTLKHFYINFGDFIKKTYLSFEAIKLLTKLDQKKAEELDLKLMLQLPILLRFLKDNAKGVANAIIQLMGLEDYAKLIRKLEFQNSDILEEKKQLYDFSGYFKWFSKKLSKMQDKQLNLFKKNAQIMKEFGG